MYAMCFSHLSAIRELPISKKDTFANERNGKIVASIAEEIHRHRSRKRLPWTGWKKIVGRLSGAWRRHAVHDPPSPVMSAELRRCLARELPDYLLRDIGLDPNDIRQRPSCM